MTAATEEGEAGEKTMPDRDAEKDTTLLRSAPVWLQTSERTDVTLEGLQAELTDMEMKHKPQFVLHQARFVLTIKSLKTDFF